MTVSVTTGTLAVPDGSLYYELRGSGPLVALVGSPMHAAAFAPVADALAESHTVLTTDPRGHFGSVLHDPDSDSTPELRAGDLAALLRHLATGPATVFGSSGGAITTLALLQANPELVHTAVAHEPPLAELLDDREQQRAVQADVIDTFRSGDTLGAVRKFFAFAGMHMPEPIFQQVFGGERTEAEIANDRYFYLHEFQGTAGWQPDLDALRATGTRLILGIGDTSGGLFCDRATRALGAELGIDPVLFPGGHGGFTEDPVKFADRLRELLT
ncbi:alpha/beta fold hydrolase [Nocardia sp. alder85J]|uniref:alpha/beta fold hydrolase n=1 Tax=Nocardia sp. alder85J TaxID=2862949 RepID=UPI001CD434E8|nr:alpha/beta hydrolase [Nocardia sp. alder85J]MCX4091779.1 alpha/beta hydrolase [Nocardia sp. alder85J]